MVSRLFGSNPFDESVGMLFIFILKVLVNLHQKPRNSIILFAIIEKATSENIPKGQEDLTLNLEISDQIRSKQVQPKDAMRTLKRKITHTNPSVQLLALSVST